jgi:hypothetical protein
MTSRPSRSFPAGIVRRDTDTRRSQVEMARRLLVTQPSIPERLLGGVSSCGLPSTNPPLQHLSKLQSVSRRGALLVVIEIDVDVVGLFLP